MLRGPGESQAVCGVAHRAIGVSCQCERSEANPIPLRTAMEIAAHALGLDPRVASLLAMTGIPAFVQVADQIAPR